MGRFVIDNRAVVNWCDDSNNLEIEPKENNSNTILDKQLLFAVQTQKANTLSNVIVINNGIISIKANINFGNFNVESSIFENVNFEKDIVFDNCRFLEKVDFGKIQFNKQIKFCSKTIFEEEVILNDFKAYGIAQKNRNYEGYSVNNEEKVIFHNVEFKKSIIKYFGDIYYALSFFNVIFHQNIDFFNSTHNSTFHQAVTFKNITFKETISFQRCQFLGKIDFTDIEFHQQVVFDNARFHQDVSFKNITFKEQADFREAIFYNKSSFNSCNFDEGFNFYGSIFHNDTSFDFSMFNKRGSFGSISIKEEKKISYSKAIFRERVFFDNIKGNKGEIMFEGCSFYDVVNFTNAKLLQLSINNCMIKEQFFLLQATIEKPNRERFRIIKDQLIKQNDQIKALEYYAKEMDAYMIELQLEKFTKYSKRLKILAPLNLIIVYGRFIVELIFDKDKENKNIKDKMILAFNYLTNRHRLNWLYGIRFIFVYSVLLFIGYSSVLLSNKQIDYIGFNYEGITNVVHNYLKFLNPVRLDNDSVVWNICYSNMNLWSFIIDFLNRIIIGLGVYQTIAAFRKFNANL